MKYSKSSRIPKGPLCLLVRRSYYLHSIYNYSSQATRLDEASLREVAREEGRALAQSYGSHVIFHEISSNTRQNVHTCFPSLLSSFLLRKFKPAPLLPPNRPTSPVSFNYPTNLNTNPSTASIPPTNVSSKNASYVSYAQRSAVDLVLLQFFRPA